MRGWTSGCFGQGVCIAWSWLSLSTSRSAKATSPCCPHHHRASRCRPHSRCPLLHSLPHNLAHSPTPMSGRLVGVHMCPILPSPLLTSELTGMVFWAQTCFYSLGCSSGPAPSPSSFLPSPSPQPSQSPVTARTPQNFSVPSPGPLNTPGKLGLGWVDSSTRCLIPLPLPRSQIV